MSPPGPVVACLSDRSLRIETYFFDYPSVEVLLKSLSSKSYVFKAGWSSGGIDLQIMLKHAGLEKMDDFCLTSPLALHVSCSGRIPVQAVTLLYVGAEKMIRMVHDEMAKEIQEIRNMRDDYAIIREYRSRCVGEGVE